MTNDDLEAAGAAVHGAGAGRLHRTE